MDGSKVSAATRMSVAGAAGQAKTQAAKIAQIEGFTD
jgi:hypothetical protein